MFSADFQQGMESVSEFKINTVTENYWLISSPFSQSDENLKNQGKIKFSLLLILNRLIIYKFTKLQVSNLTSFLITLITDRQKPHKQISFCHFVKTQVRVEYMQIKTSRRDKFTLFLRILILCVRCMQTLWRSMYNVGQTWHDPIIRVLSLIVIVYTYNVFMYIM